MEHEVRTSAAGLTPEKLRAVYHNAVKTALDRYLTQQASSPWLAEDHLLSNIDHARYFTMIASSESAPRPGYAFYRDLKDAGLSSEEINRMQTVASYYDGGSAINPAYAAAYLREAGCSPTHANIERVRRIVAAGYRAACIEASAALGAPDSANQLPPLPKALEAVVGTPALASCANPAQPPTIAPPPNAGTLPTPPTAPELEGIDCPISELAQIAFETCFANKKWSDTCRGDVRGVLKLFIAANGDLMLSQIRQSHVALMSRLFPQMPATWGKMQKGSTKAKPLFETVEQALERGKTMKKEWDADPIAAEIEEKPRPGLSVATGNKHLQWITNIFEFGSAHGYVPVRVDVKPLKLKDKEFRHEKRRAWEPEELATLISGPVWAGCADIDHRLAPGDAIIHDAMYFAPLLLISHAARSEEVNGLMLSDVIDDHGTPFIRYRDNAYRNLKTKHSRRSLPIPPQLIELGFLDYVRALRSAGKDLVFPEMWNPNAGFEKTFRDKVFYPLRDHHFPDGTSRKKDGKDVDVHSIRKTGLSRLYRSGFDTNDRNRFGGHAVVGETDSTYTEEAEATHFVSMVDELWKLVPAIDPAPLNLRPTERLQFGSPRGRPTTL
ncbi:tyrosine-type recombinase/integrase [Sphingobium sp. B8D3A]|nr:tyrosine-type recombinase/integrase [Sphingobium sp. B8D3A]MCW2411808.1 integrase [Sphingobium sp. B8D3D]